MAVIWILRASVAPIADPTATPPTISPSPCRSAPKTCRSASVATTATSMPVAPSRLPRTAVRGCVRPLIPKMKSADANRYVRLMKTVSNAS